MGERERPVVLSTRVLPHERGLVGALAALEGVSACALVHSILMPVVRARLADMAAAPDSALADRRLRERLEQDGR